MNERSLTISCNQASSPFSESFRRGVSYAGWTSLTPSDSSFVITQKTDAVMTTKNSLKKSNSVGKKKILTLARNLFWKNGYNGVSMRDLARAYGCQPANLYNHFKTKESILFEVLLEEMEQIIRPISHLKEEDNGDPLSQLRLIISSHLRITLSHRRSAKMLFDVALGNLSQADRKVIISMRDAYDNIIRKVIQRGQEKGIFSSHDQKLVGFMISSMITRSRIWFHPRRGVTINELADFIFQFALRGLLMTDGIQEGFTESGISEQSESKDTAKYPVITRKAMGKRFNPRSI